MAAQSCASVPPDPAWISRKQLLGSIGFENMRRNSMSATVRSSSSASRASPASTPSSSSLRAISKSSPASRMSLSRRDNVDTTASRDLRSLPSSCARLLSFQTAGSSISLATSASRFCFASKSKIPPQRRSTGRDVLKSFSYGVDVFCIHSSKSPGKAKLYTPDRTPFAAGSGGNSVPVFHGELHGTHAVVLVDLHPVERRDTGRKRAGRTEY